MKEYRVLFAGDIELKLIVPENLDNSEVYCETYRRFVEIFNSMTGLDIKAMRERYIRQMN